MVVRTTDDCVETHPCGLFHFTLFMSIICDWSSTSPANLAGSPQEHCCLTSTSQFFQTNPPRHNGLTLLAGSTWHRYHVLAETISLNVARSDMKMYHASCFEPKALKGECSVKVHRNNRLNVTCCLDLLYWLSVSSPWVPDSRIWSVYFGFYTRQRTFEAP